MWTRGEWDGQGARRSGRRIQGGLAAALFSLVSPDGQGVKGNQASRIRVSRGGKKWGGGTNPYLPPERPFHWKPPEDRLQKRRSMTARFSDPARAPSWLTHTRQSDTSGSDAGGPSAGVSEPLKAGHLTAVTGGVPGCSLVSSGSNLNPTCIWFLTEPQCAETSPVWTPGVCVPRTICRGSLLLPLHPAPHSSQVGFPVMLYRKHHNPLALLPQQAWSSHLHLMRHFVSELIRDKVLKDKTPPEHLSLCPVLFFPDKLPEKRDFA